MLEADRDARRRNDDPTGEVESLWGKMDGKKMGDRAAGGGLVITKSTELDDKIKKSRTKRDKRERTELDDEKRRNKSSKVAMAGKGSTVRRRASAALPRAQRCARGLASPRAAARAIARDTRRVGVASVESFVGSPSSRLATFARLARTRDDGLRAVASRDGRRAGNRRRRPHPSRDRQPTSR